MSSRNSREELGFEPEYYMEEAIDDYVNWLRERM
jgi:nucleoside-diphosphate-sugar epimerase